MKDMNDFGTIKQFIRSFLGNITRKVCATSIESLLKSGDQILY